MVFGASFSLSLSLFGSNARIHLKKERRAWRGIVPTPRYFSAQDEALVFAGGSLPSAAGGGSVSMVVLVDDAPYL
jgi:hypothetical protein